MSANGLTRCPVCTDVVPSTFLFKHMLLSHPIRAFRWGRGVLAPDQVREAYLYGVLGALIVLVVGVVLLRGLS